MKKRIVIVTTLTCAVVLTLSLGLWTPVKAWTATYGNMRMMTNTWFWQVGPGDGFYNYDFGSQNVNFTNCDFPVTLIFTNHAARWDILNYWFPDDCNGTQHAQMWNFCEDNYAYGWEWDRGSRKPNCGLLIPATHLRTYAYGGCYQYSPDLGQYVVGTTHRDYDPINAVCGWSEDKAGEVCYVCEDKGASFIASAYWFYNPEPDRWEGTKHFWQCDGWVDRILIPA